MSHIGAKLAAAGFVSGPRGSLTRTTSTSISSGGVSFDPFIRDAAGNPIGTALPPPGSTPESIAKSQEAARSSARQSFAGQQDFQRAREIAAQQQIQQPSSQRGVQIQELPPRTQEPIRSIDIARETPSGVQRVGGVTFKGREAQGRRVQLRETDGQVEVSLPPTEAEVQARQQSAAELVFGGGSLTGGLLVTGAEIGRTGEEAEQVFEVIPEQQFREERIRERQQLPIRERVKQQFETAPGIRGGIRAGIELVSIGTEKVVPERFQGPPVSTRFVEDTALFALFNPGFATSAQIERQLAEVARVEVVGVTARRGRGIRTDFGFRVSRAGRSVKGIGTAESVETFITRTQTVQGLEVTQTGRVIASGVRTQTFKTGLEVPTGRTIVQPTGRRVTSAEIATVRQRGRLFFTRGVGTTGQRQRFISGGVSTQRGRFIGQVGGTISTGGQRAVSLGVFKLKTVPSRTTFTATGSGLGFTRLSLVSPKLVAANTQVIRNAISQSVSIPPRQITNIVAVPTQRTTSLSQREIRQITSPRQFQDTSTLQRSFQVVTPVQRTRIRTRQATRTIQQQVPAQRELQKALTIQSQVPKQVLKQRALTLQRTFQQQKQTQRTIVPSFRVPRITEKPIVTFKLKPQRQPEGLFVGFTTLVRRFGVFRPVFRGELSQAFATGVGITKKTLARSFRVLDPSGRPVKVGLPSQEFRRPRGRKKDEFTVIERGKFALDQPSEVAEIQGFLAKSMKGGRR